MITGLLLLPVVSILVWLYWYCLPTENKQTRRWRWVDTLLLLILVFLAGIFMHAAIHAEYQDAGPIWPQLVAATGAYGIIVIGLSVGLILRRRSFKNRQTRSTRNPEKP